MKKKIILWTLLFSWMVVIFLFSTQDGVASGQLSSGFLHRFVLFFLPRSVAADTNLVHTLEFVVRKGAHMTEYGILAILAFAQLKTYFPWNFRKSVKIADNFLSGETTVHRRILLQYPLFQFLIAICFVFLYACTDEFHQTFVSGRSGQFRDVLIDTVGGLIGGLVFLLFAYLIRKKKEAKQ